MVAMLRSPWEGRRSDEDEVALRMTAWVRPRKRGPTWRFSETLRLAMHIIADFKRSKRGTSGSAVVTERARETQSARKAGQHRMPAG